MESEHICKKVVEIFKKENIDIESFRVNCLRQYKDIYTIQIYFEMNIDETKMTEIDLPLSGNQKTYIGFNVKCEKMNVEIINDFVLKAMKQYLKTQSKYFDNIYEKFN